MARTKETQGTSTLEGGDIYFFYRPRVHPVDHDVQPKSIDQIERSYIVLHPKGRKIYRLLVLGRKRLPDVNKREKEWGFVYKVSGNGKEIRKNLQSEVYETKTEGKRVRPAARPVGDGVYALVVCHGQIFGICRSFGTLAALPMLDGGSRLRSAPGTRCRSPRQTASLTEDLAVTDHQCAMRIIRI